MFSFFVKFALTLNFRNLIEFAINNGGSSLLLIGNLDMSYVEMK
jgi:hypothetical protein